MPSYRAQLQIGNMHQGRDPAEVLATARSELASRFTVEATDITVVARVPRIVLRFTVPAGAIEQERAAAINAGRRMRAAVSAVATTGQLEVSARVGSRWQPVLNE